MADFKAERFQVSLLNQDSRIGEEPVTVEVGLDGLKILSRDGTRALRNYAMKYITRWELRGDTLTLYAKTSVDVEERQVILSGPSRTCQLLLDSLTSFIYQYDHSPFQQTSAS